jgi:hypothetical protein
MSRFCGFSTLCVMLFSLAPVLDGEPAPDPNRGLYAIWTKPEISDHLPFLKGGQVVLQWEQVQPAMDRYDFSILREQLETIGKLGRVTTVQLNANRQPAFLYEKVPSTKKTLTKEQDRRGTLQYWHPAYVKLYTDLIAAFAHEVKASPYHDRVIGVRLNYDAIGTEFLIVPEAQRDPSNWIAPVGVTPGPEWTEEIADHYRRTVVDTFVRNFSPEIRIFLRTGNPQYKGPDRDALRLGGTGKFGFFTTASEIEPRMPTMYDGDKPIFLDYCRPGKTICYAESMADATGKHGPSQDPRWCAPLQYNYWRLLSDLNLGISMIGIYGADLANAGNPEYRAAFEFAARYAGYHASPSVSAGAWVALREGGPKLKGDYSFLMQRLPGVPLKGEQRIGPDDQRFGAWALTLPKGGKVAFALNPDFARSLAGRNAKVRVTYLDQGEGTFTVGSAQCQLTNSGRWKTMELAFTPGDIEIQSAADLTLHMVEVVRQ